MAKISAVQLEQMIRDGCERANSCSSVASSDSWQYLLAAYLLSCLEITERGRMKPSAIVEQLEAHLAAAEEWRQKDTIDTQGLCPERVYLAAYAYLRTSIEYLVRDLKRSDA